MGCVPVSEQAKKAAGEAAAAQAKAMKTRFRYTEDSQKKCPGFESTLKFPETDWRGLVYGAQLVGTMTDGKLTKKEYLDTVFTETGYKDAYVEPKTHFADVITDYLNGVEDLNEIINYIRVLALFMCKGEVLDKAENFLALMNKGDKKKPTFPGEQLEHYLTILMTLAIKIIPKYAEEGKGLEKEYADVKPEDQIRTWWRETFTGEIKKEFLQKWFMDGKFETSEARDAANRLLLPEMAPKDEAPKILLGNEALAATGLSVVGGFMAKGFNDEPQKKCKEFEGKLGLPDWTELAGAAEYCKKANEPSFKPSEEDWVKIMAKAGLEDNYKKEDTKLKSLVTKFFSKCDNFLEQWTYFAIFLAGGDPPAKFEAVWLLLNDSDANKKVASAEKWKAVLTSMMELAIVTIPGLAEVKDYEGKKPEELVAKWWTESGEVKKEVLKKWFEDRKFITAEARDTGKPDAPAPAAAAPAS